MTGAPLPRRSEGEQERPSDEREICTQSERLKRIRSPADSAIDENLHGTGAISYPRKHAHGRHRGIKLPPAMIGDPRRVDAQFGGHGNVVGMQQALDDKIAAPVPAHHFDMIPG